MDGSRRSASSLERPRSAVGALKAHTHLSWISGHPPRYEYTLTEAGRGLAPVIMALMTWGDTWVPGPSGPPVVLIHEPCGHAMHPVLTCPHCHGEVGDGNVRRVPGPGAASRANPA